MGSLTLLYGAGTMVAQVTPRSQVALGNAILLKAVL